MSDFGRIDGRDLDRYITGNYGEDQIQEDQDDVLAGLRYIADSPAQEHGGFHPEAVQTAKDAIAEIERLRSNLAALMTTAEQAANHLQELVDHELSDSAALSAIGTLGALRGVVATVKQN